MARPAARTVAGHGAAGAAAGRRSWPPTAAPVGVTGRYAITAPPAWVAVGGRPPRAVLSWAGPWPAEERWWDRIGARRRARCQVLVTSGAADDPAPAGPVRLTGRDAGGGASEAPIEVAGTGLLLVLAGSQWWVEAMYD